MHRCFLTFAAILAVGTAAADTVAFVNVNVIPMSGERSVPQQTVIVSDGIIAGIGNVDAQTTNGIGSVLVTPTATTIYTLTATNAEGSVTAKTQITVDGLLLPPVLSEFVASNNASLLDGDGLGSPPPD